MGETNDLNMQGGADNWRQLKHIREGKKSDRREENLTGRGDWDAIKMSNKSGNIN